MSGTNHVTGGTVFTALFVSFWDINIFTDVWLLFFAAFFSLLPDIDHTRAPIGKAFYPLAKYLDRKFGHRTITHSLLCYIGLYATIRLIEVIANTSHNASFIFVFAYASHLIYDMMTKQGVPLFYPFKRNPCVIPANPTLRLKSSDFKTETIIFCFFIIIGLTCQPLFSQGFWTTFNNTFSTLTHLTNEFNKSNNLLKLEYDFTKNATHYQGEAIVLHSTNSKAFIFSKNNILQINDADNIIQLQVLKTQKPFKINELYFFNITPDSLQTLIKNKPLQALKLNSNVNINYIKDNTPTSTKQANLEYVINPLFTFSTDTTKADKIKQLELLKYDLQNELQQLQSEQTSRHTIDNRITEITAIIDNMDNYNRNKLTIELQELQAKKQGLKPITTNAGRLQLQIKQIDDEIKQVNNIQLSGYIASLDL